jgi:hypothetical protein
MTSLPSSRQYTYTLLCLPALVPPIWVVRRWDDCLAIVRITTVTVTATVGGIQGREVEDPGIFFLSPAALREKTSSFPDSNPGGQLVVYDCSPLHRTPATRLGGKGCSRRCRRGEQTVGVLLRCEGCRLLAQLLIRTYGRQLKHRPL